MSPVLAGYLYLISATLLILGLRRALVSPAAAPHPDGSGTTYPGSSPPPVKENPQ